MMKKKEKTCLKSIILKFFDVIPMIPILTFLNFLAKYICTYQNYIKKNAANKVNNKAINKIAEDFEKIVAMTKLKELKQYNKNILPNYKK